MAVSGANLIDRVCAIAKMDSTASSADRALILGWLQQAAETVCVDVGITVPAEASVSLTSGTAEYVLGTSPFNTTGLLSILSMRLTDGSVTNQPVDQVTLRELDTMRQGSQAGATPFCYAVDYPAIVFYPTPTGTTTVSMRYTKVAPTVADSGTAITFLPDAFLWGCLASFATAMALRYKQQDGADQWLGDFHNDRVSGLPGLRRFRAEVGGRQRPTSQTHGSVVSSPSQDTWGL